MAITYDLADSGILELVQKVIDRRELELKEAKVTFQVLMAAKVTFQVLIAHEVHHPFDHDLAFHPEVGG